MMTELMILTRSPMLQCFPMTDFLIEQRSPNFVPSPTTHSTPTWHTFTYIHIRCVWVVFENDCFLPLSNGSISPVTWWWYWGEYSCFAPWAPTACSSPRDWRSGHASESIHQLTICCDVCVCVRERERAEKREEREWWIWALRMESIDVYVHRDSFLCTTWWCWRDCSIRP